MCAAQVTLPGSGQSFALIYSVADPEGSNRYSSTAAQACFCAVDIAQQHCSCCRCVGSHMLLLLPR